MNSTSHTHVICKCLGKYLPVSKLFLQLFCENFKDDTMTEIGVKIPSGNVEIIRESPCKGQ